MKSKGYDESEPNGPASAAVPNLAIGIGTRIKQIADRLGGKRSLANTIGVHETQLYRYINGTNAPSVLVAAEIAKVGGVSLDWLIAGTETAQAPALSSAEPLALPDYAYVPLYDARCSAGSGAWNERSRVLVNLAFTRYSLRKKGLAPDELACLRVGGDSMTGLLEDGDTVMIDLSRNTLSDEGIYVVLLDDHLYAKRLQRQFDGSVRIISHNKEYEPMTVPRDRLGEFHIIGRVVWAGGWMI